MRSQKHQNDALRHRPQFCWIIQHTIPGMLYVTATVVPPSARGLPVQFHTLDCSSGASKSTSTRTSLPPLLLTLYTASDSSGSGTRFGSGSPAPDTSHMAAFRKGVKRVSRSFRCLSHDFSRGANCRCSRGLSWDGQEVVLGPLLLLLPLLWSNSDVVSKSANVSEEARHEADGGSRSSNATAHEQV